MGMGIDKRNQMAMRAAKEIMDGMVVNLGIGIPSLVPNYLREEITVMFHAENGIVGMGPSPEQGEEDENLCNAGGYPVSLVKGGSYCDSSIAFGMIRRGRVDITILGALQVSEKGDLANWIVPGKKIPGMGGAMELAQKAKKVIVLMNHKDKSGKSKVVKNCSFPITSKACVDLIITDMAVFQVKEDGLLLLEVFEPFTLDEIRNATDCSFQVGTELLKT